MTLQRALGYADARKHQYTTLEHLLLALTNDAKASKVVQAYDVDPAALQKSLTDYIDNELIASRNRRTSPTNPARRRRFSV
ncbi:Clp protease N-terminal domain-containing protein [Bradyrhizobium sp. BWC-3-1]|uniref:Clp protease N-terminal domain-containing protein n=1 Tax=Bradyrhizobium sp. BWC-3-1 TaxID=3080012 RepID=UPI00397C5B96